MQFVGMLQIADSVDKEYDVPQFSSEISVSSESSCLSNRLENLGAKFFVGGNHTGSGKSYIEPIVHEHNHCVRVHQWRLLFVGP
jgi:hypothetical protein